MAEVEMAHVGAMYIGLESAIGEVLCQYIKHALRAAQAVRVAPASCNGRANRPVPEVSSRIAPRNLRSRAAARSKWGQVQMCTH